MVPLNVCQSDWDIDDIYGIYQKIRHNMMDIALLLLFFLCGWIGFDWLYSKTRTSGTDNSLDPFKHKNIYSDLDGLMESFFQYKKGSHNII